MSYQIVRTMRHYDRPDLKFLLWYMANVDFDTEVQPYYPNITGEAFNTEISSYIELVGQPHSADLFFNNTGGLVDYYYELVNPDERLDGVIQTIIYKDKDAYDHWQEVENIRAANSLSQIAWTLGEQNGCGSFDASNFILNGITKTDTSTGITKDLPFGPWLICKFHMLRKSVCTNVHSIIE